MILIKENTDVDKTPILTFNEITIDMLRCSQRKRRLAMSPCTKWTEKTKKYENLQKYKTILMKKNNQKIPFGLLLLNLLLKFDGFSQHFHSWIKHWSRMLHAFNIPENKIKLATYFISLGTIVWVMWSTLKRRLNLKWCFLILSHFFQRMDEIT